MPDLMPDVSIYNKPPPNTVGQLFDLVRTISAVKEYQSRSSMTQALEQATNPNDPSQIDYTKAIPAFQAAPGFKTPQDFTALSQAEQAQTQLRSWQMTEVLKRLTSIISKTDREGNLKATPNDFYQIAPFLVRAGLPAKMVNDAAEAIAGGNGEAFRNNLGLMYNLATANGGIPTVEAKTGRGGVATIPAGALSFPGTPGGVAPGPGAPGVGGVGSVTRALPTGQETAFEDATKASLALKNSQQGLPLQIANLSNLRDLSEEAATGPTANFEKRAGELWQRFFPGGSLPMDAKKLGNTEEYAKIAEQIAGQQASAGHATDAYLINAYGSNPNLELSKLGREGITNMLLGNVDAQRTQINEWHKALASGQYKDQDFYDWVNRFNKTFDPRVFQYARMAPEQQKSFRDMIRKTPGELSKLNQHYKDYTQNGWLGASTQ